MPIQQPVYNVYKFNAPYAYEYCIMYGGGGGVTGCTETAIVNFKAGDFVIGRHSGGIVTGQLGREMNGAQGQIPLSALDIVVKSVTNPGDYTKATDKPTYKSFEPGRQKQSMVTPKHIKSILIGVGAIIMVLIVLKLTKVI